MPNCNSCDGKVLRTDAFCGTCGEPVPGGKPVVPIARDPKSSGVLVTTSTGEAPTAQGAQAAAVVALSEPEPAGPDQGALSRTTIRERDRQSEPAPVLPLRRKKADPDDAPVEPVADAPPPADLGVLEPDASSSLQNIPVPPGPPILASELLREQMRPSSPGEKALKRTTATLCSAGAILTLLAGGVHPLTFVSLALLIAMVTLALSPLSYSGRAVSLFLVGSIATGVALWQQSLEAVAPEGIILASATILLSGSLLFRAYYRGARLARVAVTGGVLLLGAWFFVSGGHESLVMLEGDWQSWAPASTHMALGLLALLSLMAFMDSSTRGGAHVWAVALFVLYAVHIGLLVGSEAWPVDAAEGRIEGPTIATIVTGTIGTIVAGMALAQVLVATYQRSSSRIRGRASFAE